MRDSPPWAVALAQVQANGFSLEPDLLPNMQQHVADLVMLGALSKAQLQQIRRVLPVADQKPVAVPLVSQDMQHCSKLATCWGDHRINYQLLVFF